MPEPALFRSTGFRLAALFAALLAASSLAVVGFIRFATIDTLTRGLDTAILADADGLSERYLAQGLPGLITLIRARVRDQERAGAVYALADPFGNLIAGNLSAFPVLASDVQGFAEVAVTRDQRRTVARLRYYTLPGGFRLLVGRDAEERIALRQLINESLLASILLTTVLAIAGGWLLRRLVMRRVEAIRTTAGAIVGGDMSRRLTHRGTPDEFDQLAVTINDMLDRIARLMDGVRDVSNAIAHDLRTPLARIRARLEELGQTALSAEQGAALDAVLAEIDELMRTFNALLRIAEVDAGARRASFAPVALAPLLNDVADLYRAAAEEEGMELILELPDPALRVSGDGQLLAQALGNLIDNAMKYAALGRIVQLSGERRGDLVALTVADRGPGIPAAERERAVERFFRGERSRSRPGSGLGLSLAAAVARLHGGRLALVANEPGLRAELLLPATDRAQGA